MVPFPISVIMSRVIKINLQYKKIISFWNPISYNVENSYIHRDSFILDYAYPLTIDFYLPCNYMKILIWRIDSL